MCLTELAQVATVASLASHMAIATYLQFSNQRKGKKNAPRADPPRNMHQRKEEEAMNQAGPSHLPPIGRAIVW